MDAGVGPGAGAVHVDAEGLCYDYKCLHLYDVGEMESSFGVKRSADLSVFSEAEICYYLSRVVEEESDAVLLNGMFVRARIPIAVRDQTILAPLDAVTLRGDQKFVFVVGDMVHCAISVQMANPHWFQFFGKWNYRVMCQMNGSDGSPKYCPLLSQSVCL